jgi:hypothetical protein
MIAEVPNDEVHANLPDGGMDGMDMKGAGRLITGRRLTADW